MLEEIYEKCREKLSKSDHRIFGYLLEHEHEIQMMTAEDMARGLNLSTATISRFWTKRLQKLKGAEACPVQKYRYDSFQPYRRRAGPLA